MRPRPKISLFSYRFWENWQNNRLAPGVGAPRLGNPISAIVQDVICCKMQTMNRIVLFMICNVKRNFNSELQVIVFKSTKLVKLSHTIQGNFQIPFENQVWQVYSYNDNQPRLHGELLNGRSVLTQSGFCL